MLLMMVIVMMMMLSMPASVDYVVDEMNLN